MLPVDEFQLHVFIFLNQSDKVKLRFAGVKLASRYSDQISLYDLDPVIMIIHQYNFLCYTSLSMRVTRASKPKSHN